MNAIVTLESILTPAAAPLSAETMFGTGQVETIVSAIETQVRAEVIDVSTEAGRKAAKSLAYKVARSKTILDDIGKEHVAEIKAKSSKIDAERKTLRDRLDDLKAEVYGPVERWEETEANRVSAHEGALVEIIEAGNRADGATELELRNRIANVAASFSGRAWEEFHDRADAAHHEALTKLGAALDAAVQRERERAELEALRAEAEALRAEKAAREEADRIEAYAKAQAQEREKAMERERQAQAERDRIAAEQAAERDRQHAERLEAMKREQEELAKRQAEEAAARAVEQERARVAAEEARKAAEKAAQEAAEQKRQANKRHRAKVHADIRESLIASSIDPETADLLIEAMSAGDIPHVFITY